MTPDINLDFENTRRDLIALRVKYGARSEIGIICSLIIEQMKNLQEAIRSNDPLPMQNLPGLIKNSLAALGLKLLAARRHQ